MRVVRTRPLDGLVTPLMIMSINGMLIGDSLNWSASDGLCSNDNFGL